MRFTPLALVTIVVAAVPTQVASPPQMLTLNVGQRLVLPLDLVAVGENSVQELILVFGYNPRLVEFIELKGNDSLTATVRAVPGSSFHRVHVVWRPQEPLGHGPRRLGTLRFLARSPTAGEAGVRFPVHTISLKFADGRSVEGDEVDQLRASGLAPQVLNSDRIIINPKPLRHEGLRLRIHPHREGRDHATHPISSH